MHLCIHMNAWTGSLRAALREAFDGIVNLPAKGKKMMSGDLGDQESLINTNLWVVNS